MTGLTVGELGEQTLIARIKARLPPQAPGLLVGPGDDAAVVERPAGEEIALTTDSLVEGVHFDRAFVPFEALGHRALAVNLSDLAAMGARPLSCLLSFGLPEGTEVRDVDRLLDGFLAVAARFKVVLAGGNISSSPDVLFVDVTVLGSVSRRRILTRRGARPGDEVWVSGELGAAVAGLEWLKENRDSGFGIRDSNEDPRPDEPGLRACVERYLRPEPRVRLGLALASHRAASSCIDLSDGLADAVRQTSEASRVSLVLDAEALPIAAGARRWFEARGEPASDRAMAGGDDYELMFTSAPKCRRRLDAVRRLGGVRLTRIGAVERGGRLAVRRNGREDELPPGFAHFR
ncbi:MAG: thiamine-phosphate kinase [Acidobacteria bacterium]|nr:thiamine-phosphate kinase [Acidobacteriota bacterium]MBI3263958.1 thiamine-phosphate kinase [Acidobacteriota bacterium]